MNRIDRIDAFVTPYREPNDNDSTRTGCLVRIATGDGAVGWGEAVTLFPEAARATATIVDGLAGVLRGRDGTDIAGAWQAMREHTWWYGDGGIASFAVSALDMALWDLTGQVRGLSLVELLGGAVHASLPTVVSCHAADADLDRMAERMAGWVRDRGARGVKVGFGKRGDAHLGFDHDRDVAFVAALRGRLGAGPWLMVDVGARIRWTVADAVRRVLAFSAHDLHWIEEPLGADDPGGYAALRAKVNTLIGYGEREWTVRGIARILDTGTVDVVGVDPGRAEGVTGFARAAVLVEQHRRQLNAHAFAGPLTYAASLALSLASMSCHQLEVPPERNQLYEIGEVPAPVDGLVEPLTGPGLGVVVDEGAVRRLAGDG